MTWLIIGGGVSGLGAAKFLRLKRHVAVRVSDGKKILPDYATAFRAIGAEICDGGHHLSHLDGITNVVLSPGLPVTHLLVVEARRRGLPLISEIDLALTAFAGQVVGVTGTNGKSTTCAMLGHLLNGAAVATQVGGNFGDPPTAMLAEDRSGSVWILELSSYQLEQSNAIHPRAAIFTSFSHDHIARHGSLEGYLAAKWRIFSKMTLEDVAVIPHDIADLAERQELKMKCRVVRTFPSRLALKADGRPGIAIEGGAVHSPDGMSIDLRELGILEAHNQLNAGFSLVAAAAITGRPMTELAPFLRGFRGLPHRCEPIGTWKGLPVIEDSKSTNVESTLIALKSQLEPVLLLMGGQGKDEPYRPLLDEARKIARLVTFGASGPKIASELRSTVATSEFATLQDALENFERIDLSGVRAILFSPGCASFDEFNNYGHRGDSFRNALLTKGLRPLD